MLSYPFAGVYKALQKYVSKEEALQMMKDYAPQIGEKGKVTTYGQVAELAGEFAFGGAGEQAKLLEADGIEVADGRVDLEKYQWELLDTMSRS